MPSIWEHNEGTRGCDGPERAALDVLFSAAYEELRKLAATVRQGDPSATLNPTALVNEAWLKLSRSPGLGGCSALHFKRIAARAMRQLLVEAARKRNAEKRGGHAAAVRIAFDEDLVAEPRQGEDLILLHDALERLAHLNARQAAVVEARFFGGMEMSEVAGLLDISEATAQRDWRAARAWLAVQMRPR